MAGYPEDRSDILTFIEEEQPKYPMGFWRFPLWNGLY